MQLIRHSRQVVDHGAEEVSAIIPACGIVTPTLPSVTSANLFVNLFMYVVDGVSRPGGSTENPSHHRYQLFSVVLVQEFQLFVGCRVDVVEQVYRERHW